MVIIIREDFIDEEHYDKYVWRTPKDQYIRTDYDGKIIGYENYDAAVKEAKQEKLLHFVALPYEKRLLHYSVTLVCSLQPKQKPLVNWTAVDISEFFITDLQLYKFLKNDFRCLGYY